MKKNDNHLLHRIPLALGSGIGKQERYRSMGIELKRNKIQEIENTAVNAFNVLIKEPLTVVCIFSFLFKKRHKR